MPAAPLSAQMEDYLEAIGELCGEHGVARVKDISSRLGVTSPSVVGAVRTLKRRQLVRQEPYGFVRLTPAGEEIARSVMQRHHVLADFFQNVLGLDRETAARDACRVEHAVSPETVARLRALAEFSRETAPLAKPWAKAFERFYRGKRQRPPA